MDATSPRGKFNAIAYVPVVLFVVYGGVYVFARLTHRLVNYGSFIARPRAYSGFGFTWWELIFAPLTSFEEWFRALAGF